MHDTFIVIYVFGEGLKHIIKAAITRVCNGVVLSLPKQRVITSTPLSLMSQKKKATTQFYRVDCQN